MLPEVQRQSFNDVIVTTEHTEEHGSRHKCVVLVLPIKMIRVLLTRFYFIRR